MSPELEHILSQAQQLVGVASLEENRASQIQLISRLSNQTQPQPEENPWLAIAGSLVDDPFFDDYIAEIDKERRKFDSLAAVWDNDEDNIYSQLH
jgi:hypothetical protein